MKRIISLILSLVLFVTMMPVYSFAEMQEQGGVTEIDESLPVNDNETGDNVTKEILTESEEVNNTDTSTEESNGEQGIVSMIADAGQDATVTAELLSFGINPYGNAASAITTVNWFSRNNKQYLFLPSNIDFSKAVEYFELSDQQAQLVVNGIEVKNGESNSVFHDCGEYNLEVGDNQYTLVILTSKNVPAVFIQTESGSLDYIHENKENKESGTIITYENGKKSLDSELKQIKGRGNASWTKDKKPYNIKFDKKTKFLGMEKAKKWTLLACDGDTSFNKNAFGWYLSDRMGLPFSCDYRIVDLYINNDYLGTYMVCESVEVGGNRIDINDLDDANEEANPDVEIDELESTGNIKSLPNLLTLIPGAKKWVRKLKSPEDISGGYLMEFEVLDRYMNERSGFVTTTGQHIVLKSPESASKKEVDYIYSIVNPAFEALYSDDGYNKKGVHYSEYFDMDSMVNMYIIQELVSNLDVCLTSFFMVKPENIDKLYFYPVWDLDNAYGPHSRFGKNAKLNGTDFWWANSVYSYLTPILTLIEEPLFYNQAYRHNDFRSFVEQCWKKNSDDKVFSKSISFFRNTAATYSETAVMNAVRWNIYGTDDIETCKNSYLSSAYSILNFIENRVKSLSKGFAEDSAMLYYDANGGLGWIYQPQITSIGDSIEVLDAYNCDSLNLFSADYTRIIPSSITKKFDGWNTQADGSGTTYYPGDTITLENRTTTLYAQWIGVKEHNHRFKETVVEPTNDKWGYTKHVCISCKLVYRNNYKIPRKYKH